MGSKDPGRPRKKPSARRKADAPASASASEELLRVSQGELAEARVRLAAAEKERDLALERLKVEQGRTAEALQRNETLLDLYMHAAEAAETLRAEADRFRNLWEQAAKPGIPVKGATARVERSCSMCGSGGLVYEFEGKVYCRSCLGKKHPLLS